MFLRSCAVAALVLAAGRAPGQVIVYDDTANFAGSGSANTGATNQSGDTITIMEADDITPAAGSAGRPVTQFTFTVANFNASPVTVRPRVRIYDGNGPGGGPGTLLGAFDFAPSAFTGQTSTPVQFTVPSGQQFALPAGTFWAGLVFDDNNGTTGATAAQLNAFGQGVYNPPTVGSSQDRIFDTDSAGSWASSNPSGSILVSPAGGNPVANFGWQFQVAPVPEPGGLALCGLAAAGGAAWRRRRTAAV